MSFSFNAADPEVRLPPGRLYWSDPSMVNPKKGTPTYSMSEVAKFFFGRSYIWLRNQMRWYHPEIDELLNLPRPHGGTRFRLYDVEVLAGMLVERRIIEGERYLIAVSLVRLQAIQFGFGDQIRALMREAIDADV